MGTALSSAIPPLADGLEALGRVGSWGTEEHTNQCSDADTEAFDNRPEGRAKEGIS